MTEKVCFYNLSINNKFKTMNITHETEETFKLDSIVTETISDLEKRAKVGKTKYNTDLDRDDLSTLEWHQHHYEELLDAALYTKKIIKKLRGS